MDDDADLVARVRRGDRQAFDDLYDLYADDVFSMCLLILGDPTVARAAAGTAFALVARTRLNPLSDPTRLRSWLLELARGSALAWSGSPQARSIPVPHGVRPEDLLDGAVVPAPASLRVGLARTFDRAAVAAVAAVSAASRRAAAKAAETADTVADPAAPKIDLFKESVFPDVPNDDDVTVAAAPYARVLPLVRVDEGAGPADLETAVAASAFPGSGPSGSAADWRNRPAIAVAAALAVAVAGLTAVVSWPTSQSQLMSEAGANVAVVTPATPPAIRPSAPASAPANGAASTSPTVIPTVAGAFTSRAAAPKPAEPVMRDVVKATHPRNQDHQSPSGPSTSPTSSPSQPSTGAAPAPTTPTVKPTTPPATQTTTVPITPGEPTTPTVGDTPIATPPTDGGAPTPSSSAGPTSPAATPGGSTTAPSTPQPSPTNGKAPLPVPVLVEI